MPCQGLFVSIGRKPNTDLFIGQLAMDVSGFILTNSGTTMTSLPGVFAAGDITSNVHRKVVTAASGCSAALEALNYLNESKILITNKLLFEKQHTPLPSNYSKL